MTLILSSYDSPSKPSDDFVNLISSVLWSARGDSVVGVNDESRPFRRAAPLKPTRHVRHLPALFRSCGPWCRAPTGLLAVKAPAGEEHITVFLTCHEDAIFSWVFFFFQESRPRARGVWKDEMTGRRRGEEEEQTFLWHFVCLSAGHKSVSYTSLRRRRQTVFFLHITTSPLVIEFQLKTTHFLHYKGICTNQSVHLAY